MSPVISTAMHFSKHVCYSHDRKQIDFRDYLKNRSQFFFNQCQCWTDSFDAALFCLFLRVSICVNRWYVAVDSKYFYSSCFHFVLGVELLRHSFPFLFSQPSLLSQMPLPNKRCNGRIKLRKGFNWSIKQRYNRYTNGHHASKLFFRTSVLVLVGVCMCAGIGVTRSSLSFVIRFAIAYYYYNNYTRFSRIVEKTE